MNHHKFRKHYPAYEQVKRDFFEHSEMFYNPNAHTALATAVSGNLREPILREAVSRLTYLRQFTICA